MEGKVAGQKLRFVRAQIGQLCILSRKVGGIEGVFRHLDG